MSRAKLICLLAAAVLLAAGCGGPSKEEYEKELKELVGDGDDAREFEQDFEEALESGDTDRAQEIVDELIKDSEEDSEKLDDLEPPKEVEDTHDRLVASDKQAREALEELSDALGSGDPAAIQEAGGKFEDLESDVKEIEDDFREEDINVDLTA